MTGHINHNNEDIHKDLKKKMKHHKHLEHLGQAATIAAGAYARVIISSSFNLNYNFTQYFIKFLEL